jgi:hypothetical protein
MPALAAIYLVLFRLMIAGALHSEIKRKRLIWLLALDLIAVAIAVLAFVAYWISSLIQPVATVVPYFFLASWVWMFCWAPHDVRRCIDELQTDREKRFYIRVGIWVESAMVIPAFWFGGRAVLRTL